MHRTPEDSATRNGPSTETSPHSNRFAYDEAARQTLYSVIERRRDIRHFRPDPVADEVLARILTAANHAPSVGFSQPWDFVVVRCPERREKLHVHVEQERLAGAERFEGERRAVYLNLKLEGIREAPLNLLVTADRTRFGPAVLGRNTLLDADLYSAVCAVQNLWLAARVEGVGVGWVSLLRDEYLSEFFGLPENVVPVAYLCVGYPLAFTKKPTLEAVGWLPRLPLASLIHEGHYGAPCAAQLARELELLGEI